ncbi:unnamed protein product [Staurois parvus]|uniref:Uncharacterized protein n=1 Tax=Staurois parvus TaxID=386267 RepID=A0ABN9FUW4_9NEOB|nr:unnamed protein product [Staurois parvus]
MADNSVSECMEQRGVKPADIYRRLQAQYSDETFEWCKHFKDSCMPASDHPGHGGSQPTAVIPVNIHHVECLILDNQRITCCEISQETNLSVGTMTK